MNGSKYTDRRTVLKLTGAGIVGGVAMAGSASAHEPKDNGQIPVVPTWGDNDIYELVDAEPPSRDRLQDAEGNDSAHAPLYIIPPIPGSSHSPMFAGLDHTVPVPGGPESNNYSAQWHPKVVVEKGKPPAPGNLVNQDQNNNFLTSASRIRNATNVDIFALPEETVFTCPVRPHHDRGPKD